MGENFRLRKIQKGFTLVEILVAVAIIVIFVAASVPLMSVSTRGIIDSGEKSIATYTIQEEMEVAINDPTYNFYQEGELKIPFSNASGTYYTLLIDSVGVIKINSVVYIKEQ